MSLNDLLWLGIGLAAVYGVSYALSRSKMISERLGLRLEGPIIVLRGSSFTSHIEKLGRGRARVFRLFGDLSIAGGVLAGALGFAFLHINLIQLLQKSPSASPVIPLVPGWTIGLDALPFFAFAVLAALFPHELMHALVAAAEGIPVKSAGAFLAVLFPGGFAELDENELAKRSPRSQARVYAAGSFANLLVFLLVIALAQLLVQPLGVKVVGTMAGYPASGLLQAEDVIVAVDGRQVRTMEDFSSILSSYRPGDSVRLTVVRRGTALNVSIVLSARPGEPGKPMLGVYVQQALSSEQLYSLLWWTAVVSGSVALLNMLPLYPLDGGRLLALAISSLSSQGKRARAATTVISTYAALLLLLNVVLSVAPSTGP